jgi:hypothetical protein
MPSFFICIPALSNGCLLLTALRVTLLEEVRGIAAQSDPILAPALHSLYSRLMALAWLRTIYL